MGEVYRANDTRLDRILAIKVLRRDVANYPERRQRFEREARAVARLNHPHICDLHDIGHDRGVDFLVLEYLEGQTLADRLVKGPLPFDQVMRIAIEIARALDHAHRSGLVHRDLKPGNVMLTRSGAKVLDFGLAKLRIVDSLPALSTVAMDRPALTADNAILGTFEDMAPEQLEGRDADARSDIFAFGAVVYEIATGRKPFEAHSQAGRIGAILHTDPPSMASLRPQIPAALDRAVGRCLAKDPDHRWQSASDLIRELEWIAEGAARPDAPAVTRARRRERLAWIAALSLALSAVSLTVWQCSRRIRRARGRPVFGLDGAAARRRGERRRERVARRASSGVRGGQRADQPSVDSVAQLDDCAADRRNRGGRAPLLVAGRSVPRLRG